MMDKYSGKEQENTISINTVLNKRYKIIDVLYKDEMKVIYKAMDKRLRNSVVAIHEINSTTIEGEKLISLRHISIPRVTDFFYLNNKCYLIVDLIDGETLDKIISCQDNIDENKVKEWIEQINWVIKYLKARNFNSIYENFNLNNIILTKDNEIKIMDFGILRKSEDNVDVVEELKKLIKESEQSSKDIILEEQITVNPKKKSKKNISIIAVVILMLAGGIYVTFDKNMNNINKNSNVNSDVSNNNKSDSDNIEKAINILYETTGYSSESTVYELNTDSSYVTDERIKDEFYIFNESDAEYGSMSDRNLLVNKNDFTVYVCYPGSLIIPYEDYSNPNTPLGYYFESYLSLTEDEIPEKTKEYINKNGSLSFNKKVLELLSDSRKYTIQYFDGPVFYIERILNGDKIETLDIQAYAYPNHEFGAINIIEKMLNNYSIAVSQGDSSMIYEYTTYDGEIRESYDKNIPRYYEKGITVDLLGYQLKDIKIESEDELRVTYVTKYKITTQTEIKIQEEKADYMVILSENKEGLVDRLENWSIID